MIYLISWIKKAIGIVDIWEIDECRVRLDDMLMLREAYDDDFETRAINYHPLINNDIISSLAVYRDQP